MNTYVRPSIYSSFLVAGFTYNMVAQKTLQDCTNEKSIISWRILHECSYFIGFIKRVRGKRSNARLAEHFFLFRNELNNSIIQEHECWILY